jgi:hypothetical protein
MWTEATPSPREVRSQFLVKRAKRSGIKGVFPGDGFGLNILLDFSEDDRERNEKLPHRGLEKGWSILCMDIGER